MAAFSKKFVCVCVCVCARVLIYLYLSMLDDACQVGLDGTCQSFLLVNELISPQYLFQKVK